ncbi:hypothetical protein [Stigmatella hybrida]|uniref:hypothetical protein n=1 Tax=Stigmatella hybrida TaxID=394097 RepID=UPI001CDA6784|nr:hypothetical protein [Stigmatella hybrida]
MKRNLTLLTFALSMFSASGCNAPGPDAAPDEKGALKTQSFSVITNCPYTTPTIDREAELVIRHVKVVDDICRTQFNGTGCASPTSRGKWSFGYLMSEMAGDNNPSQFVLKWLNSFETKTRVNNFDLLARGGLNSSNLPVGITEKIVRPWRRASGCAETGTPTDCALDFSKAPFRLLAIVNRIDLAGPSDFYNPNSASPGEARFVFGMLDQNGNKLDATVILEYKLTPVHTTFTWAQKWHDLAASGPVGSAAYNAALEQITNKITARGAFPGARNGSAIGQVRTDEIAFDPNVLASKRVWELREQRLLDCSAGNLRCWLTPDTVKQTPDHTKNKSAALDSFFVNNASAIASETHVVPSTLLTGAARSKGPANEAIVWQLMNENLYAPEMGFSGPITSIMRYNFALSTCTGCHYVETNTSNLHISNRNMGEMSQFSNFLAVSIEPSTSNPHLPAHTQIFFDALSNEERLLNEPWRRACEMKRLLHLDPNPVSKTSGAH